MRVNFALLYFSEKFSNLCQNVSCNDVLFPNEYNFCNCFSYFVKGDRLRLELLGAFLYEFLYFKFEFF